MPRDESKSEIPIQSSKIRSSSSKSRSGGRTKSKIKDLWLKILDAQKKALEEQVKQERRQLTAAKDDITEEKASGDTNSDNIISSLPVNTESSLMFVGCSGSGKSTLISQFLNPTKEINPKPTVALEYVFGRRNTTNSKKVVHMWELGGGHRLHELLAIPINSSTFVNSTIAVVLDGANPGNSWFELGKWLDLLQKHQSNIMGKLKTKSPYDFSKLNLNASVRLPKDHVDTSSVRPLILPLVIIVARFDKMDEIAPAKRRLFLQAVRHTAHTYCASIITWSKRNKTQATFLRNILNHYSFSTPLKKIVQRDMGKHLVIPAGSDNFDDIGIPDGENPSNFNDLGIAMQRRAWKKVLCKVFEVPSGEEDKEERENSKIYIEPVVDAMRAEKKEELIRYRKEAERRARLAAADAGAGRKKSTKSNKSSKSRDQNSSVARATKETKEGK